MPGLKLTPFLQVKHSICCKPLCWDGSLLKYFFVSIIGVTVKKNEVRFFLRDSGNLCQNQLSLLQMVALFTAYMVSAAPVLSPLLLLFLL